MQWAIIIGLLIVCYLIGSIPFGLIFVKLTTGKDIRDIESGRTGGTNAMRAAGFWTGLATAIMDLLKGAFSVWLVRYVSSGNPWLHVLSPLAAILGHNYSIFLPERRADGKIHLRGGAGGAPCAGGAFGLWAPSLLFILPMGGLVFYFGGYASVTTLSTAVLSIFVFFATWLMGITPWQYIVYGLLAGILLAWALRPNIKRLIEGNERIVGFRARKRGEGHSSSSKNSSSSSS